MKDQEKTKEKLIGELEALRESEEKFRTVANFTHDSEYWNGPDNNLIYQSPSIERITGYTAGEHIENHPDLFFSLIHPEDKEQFSKHFEKDISSSEVTRFAFRIISRSGEIRWLENITQPVYDSEGNFLGRRGSSRDITDRKKAEEEIRKYRQDLETIFNSVPAAIWYKDRENRIVRVNKTGANSVGRKVEEIEGKPVEELFPSGDAEHYFQDDLEVMSSGKSKLDIIEEMQTSSGERLWVCTDKVPYIDSQGRIVGIIAFVRDITDRMRAEEALRESEEKYRSFMENFQGIVFRGKLEGFVPILFHGAVEEITGYTAEEFIAGKPSWDQIVYPEDLVDFQDGVKAVMEALGPAVDVEHRIICKDGQIRWVQESVHVALDNSGKPLYAEGVVYDITERKQMEENLRESEREKTNILNS